MIQSKNKIPFLDFKQKLADKHGVTVSYIDLLINSKRKPERGKGVLILQDLELVSESVKEIVK